MKTETKPLSVLDPLVTITELAEYLGVPVKTIYEWRQARRGPVGIRIGRHLKFRLSGVQTWWMASGRSVAPLPGGVTIHG